ncbi:MAG: stage II sporulation protein M [Candidatus Aenigmatarchaeota archaeon]
MVLESLIKVKEGIKSPIQIFLASGIITLFSFIISVIIFKKDVGLYSVFLITIGLTPLTSKLNLIAFKISRKNKENSITSIFSFYREIILAYAAIFCGITLVLSILYLILPVEIAERTFQTQINEIKAIRGYFYFGGTFQTILFNNLGVLLVCFIFSFVYGAGAIFILTWNASILSTAIGMTAKAIGGIYALPIAVMVYFPHGSLEILAYFLGAIAGGIASNTLIRNKLGKVIVWDIAFLLSLAVLLLLIGATIETISIIFG